MDMAAQTLNIQQGLKAAELAELIFGAFERTNKCWSDYPTAQITTTFIESLVKIVNDQARLYLVQRVGEKEFQAHFIGHNVSSDNNDATGEQDNEFKQVPIPSYWRIRHVTVETNGTMMCDCCNFEGC